jgi:hypothetical protein
MAVKGTNEVGMRSSFVREELLCFLRAISESTQIIPRNCELYVILIAGKVLSWI